MVTLNLNYASMTESQLTAEISKWSGSIPYGLVGLGLGFFSMQGGELSSRPLAGLDPLTRYDVRLDLTIQNSEPVVVTIGTRTVPITGAGPVSIEERAQSSASGVINLGVYVNAMTDGVSDPYALAAVTVTPVPVTPPIPPSGLDLLYLDYSTMTDAQLNAEADKWTSGTGAVTAYAGPGEISVWSSLQGGLLTRVLEGIGTTGHMEATVRLRVEPEHGSVTLTGTGGKTLTVGAGVHDWTLDLWPALEVPSITVTTTAYDEDFRSSPTILGFSIRRAPVDDMPIRVKMLKRAPGFMLNVGALDQDAFGSNTAVSLWEDALCDATTVQVIRGGSVVPTGVEQQVGTCTLTLVDKYNLQTIMQLTPNTPVRVEHESGRRIFTGWTRSAQLGYKRDKATGKLTIFTYVTIVDRIQRIANVKRYGASSGEFAWEKWEDRIPRLMKSSGVSYTVVGTGDAEGAPINWRRTQSVVYESSLINHLEMACKSVRARWYCTAFGNLAFEGRVGRPVRSVKMHLSDVHDTSDVKHVCYTDVDLAYDTSDLVNSLKITNHGMKIVDGKQQADDRVYGPYEDPLSINTWGAEAADLDLSLWLAGDQLEVAMKEVATEILVAQRTPDLTVRKVVLNAPTYSTALSALEIFDRLTVQVSGKTFTTEVVSIQHDVTPKRWFTTLHLRKA